ncbi:O-antigen ligase family protein [Janthinobacterium aquaticum]|uniref:O-antigen ligase family protein n=1 Tax=Janthinobacterium sp. FT58W TaxID=2654254 RepID=UPI001264F95F|nr:O-antigen ligase family protein [Janthinobacterium sp. FT58W]KAB8044001.1 hypothetical protein GCM43_07450 [Janthinobacterium sp. FT58W]
MKKMIESINKNSQSCAPWLISAAVTALALGGIGGSLQVSRLISIILLPFVLIRLFNFNKKIKFQNEILVFLFSLMIISLMSVVWSVDKTVTVQYLIVLLVNMIPLLMIGLMTLSEIEALQKLLPRAWLLAGFFVLPLAFYELITGNHFSLGFEERGGGQLINLLPFASGVHGNYNDFSLFLVFCVIGTCFSGSDQERVSKPLIFFKNIVILFVSMIVLINSSRAAILCLFAVLFAKFFLPIKRKQFFLIILVIIILGGIFIFSISNDSLLLTVLQLKFSDFSTDFEGDEGRLAIIKAGLNGVVESYGLGVGAGASSSYLAIADTVLIPNPHNLFLEWALNFGIIGSCILLWFLFRIWMSNRSNCNCNNKRINFLFILILPLLGVIQSHLTAYSYFWLILTTICVFVVCPRSQIKID